MDPMVPVFSLGLPMLLSAVAVFIASAIVHMALGYHAGDVKPVPGEDQAMEALRRLDIPPGDYMMPRAGSMKAMGDPAFIEKFKKGPVVLMTVFPRGNAPGMTKELALWFVYCFVVSFFAAMVAGEPLGPGAPYRSVFCLAATTSFCAYGLGLVQHSIWWKRAWSTTIKSLIDAVIYAVITGAIFGWLWPSM